MVSGCSVSVASACGQHMHQMTSAAPQKARQSAIFAAKHLSCRMPWKQAGPTE